MSKSYSRELDDIRRASGSAFGRQRDVLESVSRIVADASRLASRYGRNEVAPRVRHEFDSHLAPLIASGLVAGRKALSKAPGRKKATGLGGFIAAGFGVAIIAGAAYLAWQILRTDEGSWVDDDFDVD